MRILITNDDGYNSEGIRVLGQWLSRKNKVTICAPMKNMSASSYSLSLKKSLTVVESSEGVFYIDGTPSDCVHVALCGFMKGKFDVVVSGINNLPNLGDDVINSGTVGAAIEGRWLGLPAIAISLDMGRGGYFETAAVVVQNMLDNLEHAPFSSQTVLNVNVPDIPHDEIQGYKTTRLGFRHIAEDAVKDKNKDNSYFIGKVGEAADNGIGTDFYAVANNYVSITPIHVDMTKFNELSVSDEWIKEYF
jgi:5'-nucleotidase